MSFKLPKLISYSDIAIILADAYLSESGIVLTVDKKLSVGDRLVFRCTNKPTQAYIVKEVHDSHVIVEGKFNLFLVAGVKLKITQYSDVDDLIKSLDWRVKSIEEDLATSWCTMDSGNWNLQEGVLISARDAKTIVEILQKFQPNTQ